MIGVDHLMYNNYVRNRLLNDFVIDFGGVLGVDSAARDCDQSHFSDCSTHAMVNVRSCEIPKSVLQADTILVSCGLPNFEQSSWSTHLRTKEDCDKFVRSFKPNYTGMCDGRSMWTIDCRKFDG